MADVEQLIRMTSGLTDGVTRLREIVLHAAVHGTLVSQDPSDEPADVLLARSRAAIVRQTQEGKTKREKPAAALEPSEQHFELPTGWVWARIVDTGQYINGLAFKPSDWKSKGRPIIRIQNLSGRNPEFNYTDGTFDPSVVVHDGDILVSWSATLDAFIWRGVEGVLNQHIFRVLPAPLVDKAYLFWLLKWVIRRMAASDHVHGLVMGHINRGPFLAFPVPIPPLAEQKRIVAKVDELMALCDRLEAQLQERAARSAELSKAALAKFSEEPTVENLEYLFHESYAITAADLQRSILGMAVRGQLVRQAANDPAIEDSIRAARLEAGLQVWRGYDPSPDETPFDVPKSWRWVTVDDVSISRLGKMLDKEKNRGTARPYLRNTNVHWFRFELESIKEMPFEAAELEEYRVEPGDVLICEGGHGIARSAVWEGQLPGIMFQKALHRVRPLSCLDGHFLTFCLWVYERAGILQRYYTGAGIPHFTGKSLSRVLLPLPPLAEQKRIVAKVEELMALVDQLEAQLAASEEAGTKLLDALVAELAPSN